MLKSIPQCIRLKFPGVLSHQQNHFSYDFDSVCRGLLVQNCIVGMLLAHPIEIERAARSEENHIL